MKIRRIESVSSSAQLSWTRLSGAPARSGIVSVTTICSIPEFSSRSKAGPEKTPWVAQAITLAAPSSRTVWAAAQRVPAVSIMSSTSTAVIIDDIIATAGTLRAAGETVKDEGARRVYAAATHPVLSGNAFENLAASPFERIVTTDTIPLRAGAPDNITVLSVADLLTDSIRRIFTDDSVAEVFGGENQLF